MHSKPQRAFTLMELLTVFSIMAIMMGVGAGYLRSASKRIGVAASASTLETVIRASRDFSRGHGVPSRVVFDRAESRVWAAAQQTVGEWHFETEGRGYGNPYTGHGAGAINPDHVDRRWGSLYDLPGGSWIDCGTSTAFDGRSGMMIEGWVRPRTIPAVGSMVIFQKGKEFTLSVGTDAELRAEIAIVPDDPASGDRLVLETKGFVLRPMTWWHVALEYDGEAGRIHVNFTERATKLAPGLLATDEGASLTISDAKSSFVGFVDEVRFSVLVATTERTLEGGVTFEEDYPSLRFDRDGNVDLRSMELAALLALGGGRQQGVSGRAPPKVEIPLPIEVIVSRPGTSGGFKDRAALRVSYYGAVSREYLDAAGAPAPRPGTGDEVRGVDAQEGVK